MEEKIKREEVVLITLRVKMIVVRVQRAMMMTRNEVRNTNLIENISINQRRYGSAYSYVRKNYINYH